MAKYITVEIKPVKGLKRVKQSGVSTGDVLRRPQIKSGPIEPPKESIGFQGRQLVFAGKNMGTHIQHLNETNPMLLSKLANDLEHFKSDVQKRTKRKRRLLSFYDEPEFTDDEIGQIHALCDAYITKISELIQKRYDETRDGFHVEFDIDGQLILNGMNVHGLIQQCEANPNPKSLLFLKGVKGRLERLRETKRGNRNFERIEEIVSALIQRCTTLLEANCPK